MKIWYYFLCSLFACNTSLSTSGHREAACINRTSKTSIHNRSITNKRISEGCWTSTFISVPISDTCLPQSKTKHQQPKAIKHTCYVANQKVDEERKMEKLIYAQSSTNYPNPIKIPFFDAFKLYLT
jgi:hypothetical protein